MTKGNTIGLAEIKNKMNRNLAQREGWINRHIDGMPKCEATVKIITIHMGKEVEDVCVWKPYNPKDWEGKSMPAPDYLGSCTTIKGDYVGIGFNAWVGHDSEFVYYSILDTTLEDAEDSEEAIIGTTGEIVDLFNEKLTQEEWNALCVIHRMRKRLNLGVRFDWSKSIDVRSEKTSQIVDESVFLNREAEINSEEIDWEECKVIVAKNNRLGSTLVIGHAPKYWEQAAKIYKSGKI